MGLPTTKYDVAVVGGGPAGASAAYLLAKKGFKVILLERGRGGGSKELYGGRVYAPPLREVWPSLDKEAPIQRWVKQERISVTNGDRVITVQYDSPDAVSFTAYLPELARWMVSKAEEAGALFVDEIRVDAIVRDDSGRIVGVRSGPDTLYADVVVDAEGVNRLLLEGLGLVKPLKATESPIALGVKEVLRVKESVIEERFGLEKRSGLAWVIAGDITKGLPGGAFIYTFKNTVSIGVVIHLGHAYRAIEAGSFEGHVKDLVEGLRLHPFFKRFWRDADIMEYGAHLTIEGGLKFMPETLVLDGLVVVGDAAGFLLNTGYTIRGVDFAVYSGKLAAEAIEIAHNLGGMTRENLRVYEDMVRNSFIYRELVRHEGISHVMNNPEFFTKYPALAISMMRKLFEASYEHPTLYEAAIESMQDSGLSPLKVLGSLLRVVSKL